MSDPLSSASGDSGFDLPRRLRVETAALHRAVEDATGLPDSIRDRADYELLLSRTLIFHTGVMAGLSNLRWVHRWPELGVTLDVHDRTPQLRDDLAALRSPSATGDGHPDARDEHREFTDLADLLPVSSFGEALGCLYVAEGSSLGGQLLAPAIAARIGPVPVGFFLGEGRGHPIPWRATRAALRTYEFVGENPDLVIAGAVTAFEAFRAIVAPHSLERAS